MNPLLALEDVVNSDTQSDWQGVGVLFLCLALATVVVIVLNVMARRPAESPIVRKSQAASSGSVAAADSGAATLFATFVPSSSGGSRPRRQALRRKGNDARVLIADEKRTNEPKRGWLRNWSRSGLCLRTTQPWPCGASLALCPADAASDAASWIIVTVKRCVQKGKHWEVGCKFQQEIRWTSVLALASAEQDQAPTPHRA